MREKQFREKPDHARDDDGDHKQLYVAIADMRQFVPEDGFHFPVVERLHQPRGDADRILAAVEAGGEGVERRAVDDLELRHRDAARDAEIFEQVVKPGLFLPRHVMPAGHRIDDVLVKEIGDHDPGGGADGGEGERLDEIMRGKGDVCLKRTVAVERHLRQQRTGEHHHVDEQEQAAEQQHRTNLVRCDVRVKTVRGHDALLVVSGIRRSELDRRRLFELAARFAEVEEVLLGESKRTGEQGGR